LGENEISGWLAPAYLGAFEADVETEDFFDPAVDFAGLEVESVGDFDVVEVDGGVEARVRAGVDDVDDVAVAGDRASYQYLVESIRNFPTQERVADMIAGSVPPAQPDASGSRKLLGSAMPPLRPDAPFPTCLASSRTMRRFG
jgi:hypothetical protein